MDSIQTLYKNAPSPIADFIKFLKLLSVKLNIKANAPNVKVDIYFLKIPILVNPLFILPVLNLTL
jgi:hypothetical protein